MAQEYVSVTSNADSSEDLAAALEIVSDVLGVPAHPGEELELASDQPPFDLIISLVSMLTTLYMAVGGPPICKSLFDRLGKRFADRRIQVQFQLRGSGERTVLYHVFEETPNEALARIPYDHQRERQTVDPTPMRWWADGEWKTITEYQEWLRRK